MKEHQNPSIAHGPGPTFPSRGPAAWLIISRRSHIRLIKRSHSPPEGDERNQPPTSLQEGYPTSEEVPRGPMRRSRPAKAVKG